MNPLNRFVNRTKAIRAVIDGHAITARTTEGSAIVFTDEQEKLRFMHDIMAAIDAADADRNNTIGAASPGDHLNNAIAAIYANVGPSAALTDIRAAMQLLGIPEWQQMEWTHWNAEGQTEWIP